MTPTLPAALHGRANNNARRVIDALRLEAKIRRAAAVISDGRLRQTKDLMRQAALMDWAAATIEELSR